MVQLVKVAEEGALTHRRQRRRTEEEEEGDEVGVGSSSSTSFSINDNVDLLAEILCRLDGRSLGVAACVCRLWSAMCSGEEVWERLFNGGAAAPAAERKVVAALGGYRRLYRACVGPVRERIRWSSRRNRAAWGRDEAQLSLSLFSVDCYERLEGGGKQRASLMFLCKAQ